MNMYFKKINNFLFMIYRPDYNFDDILKNIQKDEIFLHRTFALKNENISNEIEELEGEEICFKIGRFINGYYLLDKDIFLTKHDFYFSENIKINKKLFISYSNISIIKSIDEIVDCDIYIVDKYDGIQGHIPYSDYISLINTFPNTTETYKYRYMRVAQSIRNYVENLGDIQLKYEKYLNKRTDFIAISRSKDIKSIRFELFTQAYESLQFMLDDAGGYSERDWQTAICDILCVLYPKYILAEREVRIGSDQRHGKRPDFLLIDSDGFVDLLEIKKPTEQRIITNSTYRNNYVADRDLSGAIVQMEKYIYTLNHGGNRVECDIQRQISDKLPEGVNVRVANPQGMLLMGRSEDLSAEQKFDLEIIKRQYKNIVDIMTYDDLLERLGNIVKKLERL